MDQMSPCTAGKDAASRFTVTLGMYSDEMHELERQDQGFCLYFCALQCFFGMVETGKGSAEIPREIFSVLPSPRQMC